MRLRASSSPASYLGVVVGSLCSVARRIRRGEGGEADEEEVEVGEQEKI